MFAQTIFATVSGALSFICAIGWGVATGTGWFVIELAATLVQAEVSSARIAIVADHWNVAALAGQTLAWQEADVVGAERAVVALFIALTGRADAGRALKEFAVPSEGMAFSTGAGKAVITEVRLVATQPLHAGVGIARIVAGAVDVICTRLLAPWDGDVLAAN
jgi:hypothetical protein